MTKKILFVVHAMGVGGVERLLVNMANGLIGRGYQITVAVTSDKLQMASLFHPAVRIISKNEKQFPILRKLPYIRNFYESGMWSTRKSPQRLYRHFVGTKEKFDVEIAMFFGKPLKVVCGSPNKRSKKILWVNTDYSQCDGWAMGFKNKDDAVKAYHWFDTCVMCGTSDMLKNAFVQATGRSHHIVGMPNMNNVPEIICKAEEPTACKKQSFTFVSVGRLSEEKGFDRLLEATKRLNEEGYSFAVWLVGDGSEKEKLQGYIDRNQLNNVVMLGNQDNPYPYIRNADMFVCPSYQEAYGLVIAEAFILKTPVIATRTAAAQEHLGNGEFGIEAENSTEGIYQGMKSVLDDPALYTRYRAAAAKCSTKYDPDRILDQIETLFEEA